MNFDDLNNFEIAKLNVLSCMNLLSNFKNFIIFVQDSIGLTGVWPKKQNTPCLPPCLYLEIGAVLLGENGGFHG